MHNIQTTLNLDQNVTAGNKGRHQYLLQENLADSLQMGNLEATSSCTEVSNCSFCSSRQVPKYHVQTLDNNKERNWNQQEAEPIVEHEVFSLQDGS